MAVQCQIRSADPALEMSLKAAESSLCKGAVQASPSKCNYVVISQTYTLGYQLSVDMVPQILTTPTELDERPIQVFTSCQWVLCI